MTEDERQRRGLRRYALIDPVVDRKLERGEKTATYLNLVGLIWFIRRISVFFMTSVQLG